MIKKESIIENAVLLNFYLSNSTKTLRVQLLSTLILIRNIY